MTGPPAVRRTDAADRQRTQPHARVHAPDVTESARAQCDERLRTAVPALLRLAFQLTGDSAAAADAVVVALSRHRRTGAADADRRLVATVVRGAVRRRSTPSGTALDDLSPRQRACVVLAFGAGWDPGSIAEALLTTTRRVRRQVTTALATQESEEWRRVLADARWALPPDGVLDAARARSRLDRDRRRRVLLALGSSATVVAGLLVAVDRVVDVPEPPLATAHVPGLAPWPARGPLVGDDGFVGAASEAWRTGPGAPHGGVFVLYAGPVDGRRVAVLQALDAAGRGAVAVVTDDGEHGGPHGPTVRSVAPLDGTAAIGVAVTTAPASPAVSHPDLVWQRLLLAPGVTRLSERPPSAATPDARPGFVPRAVLDGLSEPWPRPVGSGGTGIRLNRPDGSAYRGVLLAGSAQPIEVRTTPLPPPRRWQGLPHALPAAALADDVLWWAQTCGRADPVVRLVWVGGAPAFPARVRMELVSCPGVGRAAVFLTGGAEGSVLLNSHRGSAAAYATEFPGLPSFGLGTLLVVASSRVAAIHVGDRVFHDRVVRLPLHEAGPVRAVGDTGMRLRVR